jgi:hypothetical protein
MARFATVSLVNEKNYNFLKYNILFINASETEKLIGGVNRA